MAGVVAGVGMVAGMSFSGATPGTSTTVDTFIGGLPGWIGQLNLAIVALLVNLIVMFVVSALTRGAAPERTGRFERERAREGAIVEG
jgi:solute:Na+ symporter, SSS family